MRHAIVVFAVAVMLFSIGCGSRKPVETVAEPEATGVAQGEQVVVQPGTEIKDVKPVDEGVKIGDEGVKERRITDMTLEEINSAEFLKNIYFEFDKYDLIDDALAQLQQNARWLLGNTSVEVMIEGHCDERGTEEYNMSLGEKRAMSAYNYLINMGVDARRLSIVSYGESRPEDPSSSEGAWAKNRRCHFRVIKR